MSLCRKYSLVALVVLILCLVTTVAAAAPLSRGSKGSAVTTLQKQLSSAGYYDGPVTSYFGLMTRSALIAFQRSAGLTADGVAGPATLKALTARTTRSSQATAGGSAPLERGSDGPAVTALQQQLASAGYFNGPVTNYFGLITKNALIAFQRAAGLTADGIAGPATLEALAAKTSHPEPVAAEAPPAPKPVSQPEPDQKKPATPTSPETSLAKPGSYEVVGYYCQYHANDLLSYQSLEASPAGTLDAIAVFLYSVTRDGAIVGGDASRSVELAKKMGVKPLALINNAPSGKFNKDVVHRVLSDAKIRAKAVDNILKTLKANGFSGVNIDFEAVPPADRDNYTRFVRLLAEKLKPEGLMVTLSVPAKKKEDPTNSWSAAFDYWSLGEVADRIMIMTYDEHWSTAPAGPIAGVDWVEMMLKFATSAIPSHKILMGLATYGYDWQVGSSRARAVSSARAVETAKSGGTKNYWDDTAKVPYYTYKEGRYQRIVYYENAKSAAEKLSLVEKYRLGGIAIWRLGYEDPELWSVIHSMLRPKAVLQ